MLIKFSVVKACASFVDFNLIEKGLEKDMIGTLHLQVLLKLLEGTMIQFVLLLEVRIFQFVMRFLYYWLGRVQMVIVDCDIKPGCQSLPKIIYYLEQICLVNIGIPSV